MEPSLSCSWSHFSSPGSIIGTENCSTIWSYFTCHVEALLVPVDQLLDGRRQLAIGRDDGHELTEIQPAGQGEVAAERVEDEGRELRQHVVGELTANLRTKSRLRIENSRISRWSMRHFSKVLVPWLCTAEMPSTTSPMRPARARDSIWRWRLSFSCSRRRRGMSTPWMNTMKPAISPSQKLWTMMKNSAVAAWPARSAAR